MEKVDGNRIINLCSSHGKKGRMKKIISQTFNHFHKRRREELLVGGCKSPRFFKRSTLQKLVSFNKREQVRNRLNTPFKWNKNGLDISVYNPFFKLKLYGGTVPFGLHIMSPSGKTSKAGYSMSSRVGVRGFHTGDLDGGGGGSRETHSKGYALRHPAKGKVNSASKDVQPVGKGKTNRPRLNIYDAQPEGDGNHRCATPSGKGTHQRRRTVGQRSSPQGGGFPGTSKMRSTLRTSPPGMHIENVQPLRGKVGEGIDKFQKSTFNLTIDKFQKSTFNLTIDKSPKYVKVRGFEGKDPVGPKDKFKHPFKRDEKELINYAQLKNYAQMGLRSASGSSGGDLVARVNNERLIRKVSIFAPNSYYKSSLIGENLSRIKTFHPNPTRGLRMRGGGKRGLKRGLQRSCNNVPPLKPFPYKSSASYKGKGSSFLKLWSRIDLPPRSHIFDAGTLTPITQRTVINSDTSLVRKKQAPLLKFTRILGYKKKRSLPALSTLSPLPSGVSNPLGGEEIILPTPSEGSRVSIEKKVFPGGDLPVTSFNSGARTGVQVSPQTMNPSSTEPRISPAPPQPVVSGVKKKNVSLPVRPGGKKGAPSLLPEKFSKEYQRNSYKERYGKIAGGKSGPGGKKVKVGKRVRLDQLPLVINQSLENSRPTLEVRKKRMGRNVRLIPSVVRKKRGERLALRPLIGGTRKKGKVFSQFLASQLLESFHGKGVGREVRDAAHKTAEGNRSFLRFRWW
jgi:ribosomal protein S7